MKNDIGVRAIDDGDALDIESLTRWMRANVADFAGPLVAERFAGGQSSPTLMHRVESGSPFD